jgi:multicomponent Na+:H+ antiporter subunit D
MLSFFATVPIVIACFFYIFPFEKTGKYLAIAAQVVLTCGSLYLFYLCRQNEVISAIGNYGGIMGITMRADTLSSVFVVLVSFLFLAASVYGLHEEASKLFWFFMFIWQGLLNGIFLTRDLFNIFVLAEVATVVVSVMMMYNRNKRSQYDGMLYLMVNTVAIQFYLFGIGYLYKITGAMDMCAVTSSIEGLSKSSLLLPFALIMTAVSLKCALIPLYSWLPRAHGSPGAPSIVSAILSGLHVKSGIYLFIRFQSVFSVLDMSPFFLALGAVTAIIGFVLALSQTDIKLILAYSTISQIGLIMVGLNLSDSYAYTGSVYHIINHALFKSALFLCAGIISQAYKTRSLGSIRGVMRRMPAVGAATVMAILGITGTPFFNGSISKYFIMSGADIPTSAALILINLGTIMIFIRYSAILFGRADSEIDAVKIGAGKQAVISVLGLLCLTGGIFGEQFIQLLFNASVSVDAAGYFQKIVFFSFSCAAGYFTVKYFVNKSPIFTRLKRLDIGFKGICALMGGFFGVLLAAGNIIT